MMLIITSILAPENPQWMIFASYAVLSIGWSGITLLWNLGSIFFAKNRDVARYTGAHIVMVGLRGCLALVLSMILVELISCRQAFIFTLACWLTGSMLMYLQWRLHYRKKGLALDFSEKQ